jgi:uncharacterized protein YggE
MKIKYFIGLALVVVMAVLGVGLTGCSTNGTVSAQQQPVTVSVNSQQGIWVSGEGRVTVTPNIATVSLGVSAQAATVADAQSQAATAMDKVISALTSNGVDKKDIQTQSFNIQQTTRYDNNTQKTVVTGYQVSNIVSAKIRTIDKVGPIIDAVAAAGGDLTRVNGVSFSVDQPDQYYSQARQLAVADAKAKADQLAKLAGVTLGKATYIAENSSNSPPVIYPSAVGAVAAPSPTTSINPGQTDIVLDVQVAYAIQ